jgi:polysaccharide deacetylase family protein (PEP-CTERM system associated)
MESRVTENVLRLLDLLASTDSQATFFVLGWVAERHPHLPKTIADAGHEISSHGWDHRRVADHDREDFRSSVRRTRQLLQDLTGQPILGYRAPTFSIVPGFEWALDVLIEEGHGYDSSLFPIRRPGYGYPNGERDPHWIERPEGRLAEIPPVTLRLFGVNLPAAGGAYFRTLPYALARSALKDCERRGVPATFYIHPWELDPGQPRLDVPWLTRMRHYSGLSRCAERLRRLLSDFQFRAIAETVRSL